MADTVDDINRYESGEMSEQETIDFFQKLVNSGLAWRLQGNYGRVARSLLDTGAITSPFKVAEGSEEEATAIECEACGKSFSSQEELSRHEHSTSVRWDDTWGLIEE